MIQYIVVVYREITNNIVQDPICSFPKKCKKKLKTVYIRTVRLLHFQSEYAIITMYYCKVDKNGENIHISKTIRLLFQQISILKEGGNDDAGDKI